ncbi:hypothetical protein TSAR_010458, partial [Trichomalopsis sarcophagae]
IINFGSQRPTICSSSAIYGLTLWSARICSSSGYINTDLERIVLAPFEVCAVTKMIEINLFSFTDIIMGFVEVIKTGSIEKLQELIDVEGLPINDVWIDYDLLNYALAKGQKESAMMLIERGCRVNSKVLASSVDTPLHHAIKLGSIKLRKGALIGAKYFKGETPLHLSAKLRNNVFADLLLSSLNNTTDNHMDSSGLKGKGVCKMINLKHHTRKLGN